MDKTCYFVKGENEIQNGSILIHIRWIDSSIDLLTKNLLNLMEKYTWQSTIYVKNHYR
jgi:hypothetical protein